MERRKSRAVRVGHCLIGGGSPITIQSMTNTKTENAEETIRQIHALESAGCDIVRVAVPHEEAAKSLRKIKASIRIPLVADIHFDYRLAILAMEQGADKIRINPGNIGSEERIRAVADCARAHGVPIRVGVNSGSLEKEILEKYGGVTAQGIVESALCQVRLLEKLGHDNLVISIKSSNVPMCIRAHALIAEKTDYPLHVGITESGNLYQGTIKSSVGIGAILAMGIGDTIRVSLTGDPVEEVRAAKVILRTLGLRTGGIEVISCPTCGRTNIDLVTLCNQVTQLAEQYDKPMKVAVMGCVVNGPGEAREADLGIAGGIGEGLLFRKGQILRKVPEERLLEELIKEIEAYEPEKRG